MSSTASVRPQPQPQARPAEPRPAPNPQTSPWRQDDFQAALRQAEARRSPEEKEPLAAKPEKPEKDGAEVLQADIAVQRCDSGQPSYEEPKDNRLEAVFGPAPAQAGVVAIEAPHAATGLVDAEAFGAMLEQAERAAAAATDASKSVQMAFVDARSPLAGLDVSRGPDGALSLRLAARPDAAPQVSKSLEALKRRLLDRGLPVAEVRVDSEDALAERLSERR